LRLCPRRAPTLGLAFALLAAPACLPKDTRPPPSRVRLTATPSPDTKAGALAEPTADGWDITFDRVLVSIGRAALDGPDCSVYSDPRYGRVLSLIGAPAGQKISESYGLGRCDFGFAIGNPSSDSLLGVGATLADLAFMRTAGDDRYSEPGGISAFVSGSAQSGERTITFAWAFRGRARYRECRPGPEGAGQGSLSLKQDGDVAVDVTLHAEALFAESASDPAAALRFEPIASADALGNGDGEVTLDELGQVPLSELQMDDRYLQGPREREAGEWTTLEDFIYLGTAPHVARHEGPDGTCTLGLGDMRDEDEN
jgi:hypothetical protein